MLAYIQKKYDFTDYQTAQLKYFFTITFSEVSKFIIISIFFHKQFGVYLYAFFLLSMLRLSVGGLHAKTYWGCFFVTLLFFYTAICILPQIRIAKQAMTFLLTGCMLITYRIGTVSSSLRKEPDADHKKRLALQSLFIISIHILLFHLFDNTLFMAGSWTVILQTIQLIAAKFQRRGGESSEI